MKDVLYKNIKKRRKDLNMSQQELAELVGYSGKSMISQVEKGLIDISRSTITKFAIALHCSESYLMGWTDNPDPYATDNEKEMSDADKKALMAAYNFTKENYEKVKLAMDFYAKYVKAPPHIQAAIETLLKSESQDP